jgi:hypothetical protein
MRCIPEGSYPVGPAPMMSTSTLSPSLVVILGLDNGSLATL